MIGTVIRGQNRIRSSRRSFGSNASTMRPMCTPPYGFIMSWELIEVLPYLCVRPFGGVSLSRLFSFRRACFLAPAMASADSCPIPGMLPCRAPLPKEVPTGQVSPDKNVNCAYATAAFTTSPESRALSCCADLPGDSALYAISVSRIRSGTGLAHRFALRLPSDGPSRFRPCLRLVLVSMYLTLTGFTYRGLSPHKFMPVPGLHKRIHLSKSVHDPFGLMPKFCR